jgi:hypothetical protein
MVGGFYGNFSSPIFVLAYKGITDETNVFFPLTDSHSLHGL